MKVIRPIRGDDLDALLAMAKEAGAGFTSLPPVREFLAKKIELSERSYSATISEPGHERYMFVLEDTDTGRIGGCCAVEAACGLDEAFYNYHIGMTVHACRELDVYNKFPTLYLTNDYTGTSVMCSLYLSPEFRRGGAGRLLSKCRFMLMAQYPDRFAQRVIAEMRGISDAEGKSPFWESLGRHFFGIEYDRAEHLVGMGNKSFIAELMPKHPVYARLLSKEAQDAMGQVHPHTAPALHLLEQEGFRMQGYIDIFDGGPAVEAPLSEIRTIRHSQVLPVKIGQPKPGARHLIANSELQNFRCTLAELAPEGEHITLSSELAAGLQVVEGEPVRLSPL